MTTNCDKCEEFVKRLHNMQADRLELCKRIRELTATLAKTKAYREVINDALVVANIGVATGDAEADLVKLICWEVDVALDPRVSKRAADLLAEREGEIERLREKSNRWKTTIAKLVATKMLLTAQLQAAESLAAERQKEIERLKKIEVKYNWNRQQDWGDDAARYYKEKWIKAESTINTLQEEIDAIKRNMGE